MNTQKMPLKNSLCLLLAATIWGIAFVAQSVGMEYVGPFTFNGVRSLIGAAVLVPVIFLLNRSKDTASAAADPSTSTTTSSPYKTRDLWIGGIACGIALFAASNFQQFGIKYTTVGKAGFITACYIVIVPIIGLFLKKKCSPFIWTAVVMALIGLYLLCITDGFSIGLGDVLVLVCAFLFSLHILVIDYFSPKTDGVKMSCIQFLTGGMLGAICMFLFESPNMAMILNAAGPILYTGIMSTGVGYTLQILGQKGLNPTVAALIMSLESVFSALSGYLFLHQLLTTRELIGCVLMFIAIVLAQLPDIRRKV